MPGVFPHLHVASGYSLQYGANHPETLVERAAEQEMDLLALTDRDGVYGAVKFAKACLRAGIAPVLGVELGYRPTLPSAGPGADRARPSSRTPVRGGRFRDPRLPRVTLLAATDGRGGQAGWAALCRLVSATHLAGERGAPVLDLDLLAETAGEALAAGDLRVLLGPASEVGEAVTRHRGDQALAALAPWRELVPSAQLCLELVSHRLPAQGGSWGPGSTAHAARMLGVARQAGVSPVLTNAVRYADRRDAPVVDVLDAARRLVALERRHLDRGNAEGFLKSGRQMAEIAEEITRAAGEGSALRLLADTRETAERCALDPAADLGLGEVHFPEFEPSRGGGPGGEAVSAEEMLRRRCEGAIGRRYGSAPRQVIWKRLDDELTTIRTLGYASYFLTVGDVTDLIREMGVRCAARGSGAGSLVNYLLGVSGVDPIRHGLMMERFLTVRRSSLPDIDLDVESARRAEVYEKILDRYGGERCVCVSMMDTYRVRHAVRDVGAALGMPPGEIDAIAKAFPHIRARDARLAVRELPELRASGVGEARLDLLLDLVERLDGLPRHVAVHPCGMILSDRTLLDRTPVEASYAGFPMSQFDKDDVEDLGLLKLDVLGIRMQSAMAHAVAEISRVDGVQVDLDDQSRVPLDDPATYELISSARTLGMFQIESPGQRELVGKSGIESFDDIVTDISLFRPGPVKSDMVTPYLEAKQGWRLPRYLHDDVRPVLRPTHGVVVFHEQVIQIIGDLAGISYAEADERRRALGDVEGMAATKEWFIPRLRRRGYSPAVVDEVWRVLEAFASFGFCQAHAAAFALPTFQSAWLKTHWPAHFFAGLLTHDPGMYPKRLILDDARQFGIAVLGIDVNASGREYLVELLPEDGYALRVALSEVKGISEAEVQRILAARPYTSLSDCWHRARVSSPVMERLVLAGAFDEIYVLRDSEVSSRGRVTRRDLLLQVSELERHSRAVERAGQGRGITRGVGARRRIPDQRGRAVTNAEEAAARNSTDPRLRGEAARPERHALAESGVWAQASAQSRATQPPAPVRSVQLALDLGDDPVEGEVSGLPELSAVERTRAELEILGLDVSRHVLDSYAPFFAALGVTRSSELLQSRSRSSLLVAGVKVATQTPPIRSGRRVIFLTLDDATGPVDATFFDDAQGPYAATVFHSWLLVVRGVLRRTGPRGVSLRATGCWELSALHDLWRARGLEAVQAQLTRQVEEKETHAPEQRRVLVHSSGFTMSPYADIRPAGEDTRAQVGSQVARRLWHRSPGSPG